MIDADTLRSLLDYDPDIGVFTWRVTRGGYVKEGHEAGCVNGRGYISIQIQGKKYAAHRLAWLYIYGVMPQDQIDHINRTRSDNRIVNLREATATQNIANTRKYRGYLPKGVRKNHGKFQARIQIDNCLVNLGFYETPEQAHAAYCEAAQKEFGAYHRAG